MTANILQHVDNPPDPHGVPSRALPTWRHVAPQVCRWSNVTELDLSGLEVLVMTVHHLDTIATQAEQAEGQAPQTFVRLRDEFRAMLGEWCQSFLLGPETLEEITAPSGRTLAELLGRGGATCKAI